MNEGLAFDVLFVEGGAVTGCILSVYGGTACEVVVAGQIFFCAHIQVVVMRIVKDGING